MTYKSYVRRRVLLEKLRGGLLLLFVCLSFVTLGHELCADPGYPTTPGNYNQGLTYSHSALSEYHPSKM